MSRRRSTMPTVRSLIGVMSLLIMLGTGCKDDRPARPTRDDVRVLIPAPYKEQILGMLETDDQVTLPFEVDWEDVPFYAGRDAVFAPSLAARFADSDPDADVFFIDLYRLGSFRPGWLTPFPPEAVKEFRPAFLQAARLDGENVYALPWSAKGNFLFYRRDLVPDPPRTFAELRETCEQLVLSKPNRLRYCLLLDWGAIENDLYPVLWSLFDDPDAMRLDDPRVVTFLMELTGMLGQELTSGMRMMPTSEQLPQVGSRIHDRFAGGEAVFMINWNNRYRFMQAAAEKAKRTLPPVGIAPIPTGREGATAWSNIGTWGWIVPQPARRAPKQSVQRHQRAMDFVQKIASARAVADFVEREGILPARRDVPLPKDLEGVLSPEVVAALNSDANGTDGESGFQFRDRGSDAFVHGFVRDAIRDVLSCGAVRPGGAQVGITGDCGRFHEACLRRGEHPQTCVSEAVRLRLEAAQDNIDQVSVERMGPKPANRAAPAPGDTGASNPSSEGDGGADE